MHIADGERALQCLCWFCMCRKLRSFSVAGRGYCTASKQQGEKVERRQRSRRKNSRQKKKKKKSPNKELRRKLARERLGRKTMEGELGKGGTNTCMGEIRR